MKRLISMISVGLLTLSFTGISATKSHSPFPEAYAGLNSSAYHRVQLTNNKASQLSFQLEGTQVTVSLGSTKSATSGSSNVSFTQAIEGGSISATKGKNSLFGQMHLNNKHYILTTNQSGIWAVEMPETGLHFNSCGTEHPKKSQHLTATTSQQKAAGTIIDVLMLYDRAIEDRYPGELLQTRVDQYFNVANQSYANSGIDLAIRQVGLEQTNYNFNDANFDLRNLIQTSLSNGVDLQGLEGLNQWYQDTGADLVIFLRTHNIETRGNCGIAFFPVQNNGVFDSSFGVNIMADGMSSWSLCTDQLMVHEIGHNLSAGHHNWDPTQFGFPSDARGFAKVGQYGTIMGSFGTGTADRFYELDVFSSPAVQCGGGPCGVAGISNNVNMHNQLKGPVASYQPSVSSAPLPADFTRANPDQDGDGVSDWDDEFPFNNQETTDSDGDGVGDNEDAFPNNANEQKDFDGDGIGDNADFDDDQDGILDSEDDFPFDSSEVKDSDRDGVGDNTDDFVFEIDEYRDYDGDGLGNHEDTDDDDDQVIDLSSDRQDILVISVGNNRILRFDAHTGLSKGIEVLPSDGLLTFQSDLASDEITQTLFYSTNSSIKTLDLMSRSSDSQLLLPAYSDTGPSLGTGFPTALELGSSSKTFMVAKLRNTDMTFYNYSAINNPFPISIESVSEPETENIIDLKNTGEYVYALGQNFRIYRADGQIASRPDLVNFELVGNGNLGWLEDPYAFVVTDNEVLIHTDQGRDKLLMTNGNDGTYIDIFADIADLGYSNPTGIELTQDGRLLVAVADQNAILQFDLSSREFLGELVSGFGLDQPHKMVLVPQLVDRFHEDENKVIRPNAGSWYNPSTSGRGFNIGIFGDLIQVLWYTYDEQGLPIWYFSADYLLGTSYETELLKATQIDDSTVSFENVGTITIEFDNEREAQMTWQLGANSGEEAIEWLPFSVEPESNNYTGLWSRPDTPGWGLAVTTIGDSSITIPFIYDGAGEPRWVISDVQTGSEPLNFEVFSVFSEGLCPTCTGPISTNSVSSGTMTLNLGDDPDWSSAMLWADPLPGSWNLNQTELVRISSPPTRPR